MTGGRSLPLLLACLVLSCGGDPESNGVPPAAPPPRGTGFVDRTAFAGLPVPNHTGAPGRKDCIVEAKGGGVLLLDYDGDGDEDVYVVDGNRPGIDDRGRVTSRTAAPEAGNRLLRNDGGWRFADVTDAAGVGDTSYGFGGAVGDFDSDGRPDLFVANWGRNVLYRNRGDGTFEDATAAAGVSGGDDDYTTCAAFLDADGDGDLDLYVANYVRIDEWLLGRTDRGRGGRWFGMPVFSGPRGIPAALDRFYRNRGDGTFVEEPGALSGQIARYSFSVVPGDLDGDGDLDVYVANDSLENGLWENDGTGRFRDRGILAGAAYDASGQVQAGMGADSADYDQDGRPDLVVTNFSSDTNTLYRNETNAERGLFFVDATERSGLGHGDREKVCWGVGFEDFDLDGVLDLFVAAGHVYPEADRMAATLGTSYRQTASLWRGTGAPDWRFSRWPPDAAGPGLSTPVVGRGAAFADFDSDGDVDVWISVLNGRPLLLENRLPGRGHGLSIDLEGDGRAVDRDAIGARVTVTAPGVRQARERRRAASFMASNSPRLIFGLGAHERAERVSVRWLDGTEQDFEDVPADRRYRLHYGGELEPADAE